jgi:hypothetical protein
VSQYNKPSTKEFRHIVRVGLAYTLHKLFNAERFDKEFSMIAQAGMSHLEHDRRGVWKPPDPRNNDILPDALHMVYMHMGYLPINKIVILEFYHGVVSGSTTIATV